MNLDSILVISLILLKNNIQLLHIEVGPIRQQHPIPPLLNNPKLLPSHLILQAIRFLHH
jgi:hypothetical protein